MDIDNCEWSSSWNTANDDDDDDDYDDGGDDDDNRAESSGRLFNSRWRLWGSQTSTQLIKKNRAREIIKCVIIVTDN